MSLLDRLKKNTTIKEASILSKSKFFKQKDMVQTEVPMINVALSGSLDGGITPGLTMLAGPSKHFKSAFGLLLASSYLKKYKIKPKPPAPVKKANRKKRLDLPASPSLESFFIDKDKMLVPKNQIAKVRGMK